MTADLPRTARFESEPLRRFIDNAVQECRKCLDSRDENGVPSHLPRTSGLLFGRSDESEIAISDIQFVQNVRDRDESVMAEFEDPTQGFMFRRPSEIYDFIYRVPRDQLYDMVFFFDTSIQGISGPIEEEMKQACEEWAKAYPQSTLSYWTDDRGRVVIEDRRVSWPEEVIELDDLQSNAYLGMFQVAGREGIRRRLAEGGHSVGDGDIEEMLHYFVDRGLAFEDEGRYVSVAPEVDPYRRKLINGKEVAAS
ncbi:hypothetical protein SUDANB58_04113 [Streptomyces sp. enrichment culture]|uniref:hypothetical protein n=1 Tax=Streptomyces sp. enrichment culture TaxID=1795815 RepID=UPI003F579364